MKEILRFKYKNTELCLLEQNGELNYVKIQDGNFNYEVTSEEKEIINKVLAKLTPSKNIYDLGIIHYNMKDFHHFYDVEKKFHLFYEGADLKIPNEEDMLNLNLVFNNQDEYFAHANDYQFKNKKKKNSIKRILVVGGAIIVVVINVLGLKLVHNLAADDGPITLVAQVPRSTFEPTRRPLSDIPVAISETLTPLTSSTFPPIALESINNALDTNTLLTDNEKQFFKYVYATIPDIIPYLNGALNYNINKLDINYKPELAYSEQGSANKIFNNIEIYNCENFETAPKDILAEEAIHFLNSERLPSVGNTFYDFLCQKLVAERMPNVTRETTENFGYASKYCAILAEFINPEALKKYVANSNSEIIIQELMQIINGDYNLAYNLLSNIDKYNTILSTCTSDAEIMKWQNELQNIRLSIENTLTKYYTAKYEMNGEVNLNILYNLDKEKAISYIASEIGIDSETLKSILENLDAVTVQSSKSIFDASQDMILNFPYYMRVIKKIYHRDQLLTGVDGLKYNSISEIASLPHPTETDYDHYVYTFDDTRYTSYVVPRNSFGKTSGK